jgi:hypothetical protein
MTNKVHKIQIELSEKELDYFKNVVESDNIRFDSMRPEIKNQSVVKESTTLIKSLRRKLENVEASSAYSV